jgi:hypothetical protein
MVDRYCVSNDWTVAHVFIWEQDKYLYADSNLRCDYLWVDRYWVINRHDFDDMDCHECNYYFYKSRDDNSPFCSKLKQKIAVENSINHCFVKTVFFPCLFTPPFFDRQFLWNRSCSPPSLRYGCGTKVTPLFVLRN